MRRRLWILGSLSLLIAVRGDAFVNVAQSADMAGAPRWSPTDLFGRGLGDGELAVSIAPGFAEAITLAVTGQTLPQDVADTQQAVAAAFNEWQSPVLHFEVTFGGATVIGPSTGAEIDVFNVLSTDPNFDPGAIAAVTYMLWLPQANRTLTNGQVLAGNTIYGADIFVATDRLATLSSALTREQQLRALQRLLAHEIGHAIGLHHPQDYPTVNFDTDTDPANAMLVDPTDPLGSLVQSPNFDSLSIMNRFPSDLNVLFYTTLRNDDRGGRDVLYPALGGTQDVCQPAPLAGCGAALKSKLQIRDDADDTKDKLTWKWLKGTAPMPSDFGTPGSSTRFSLCLYRGTLPSLIGELALPPGGRWTAVPGKGFRYDDAAGAPHGVGKAMLKAGGLNKAKIVLKAGGGNLPDGWLPLGAPVVAQLMRADTMGCWVAEYESGEVTADSSTEFKAKAQ